MSENQFSFTSVTLLNLVNFQGEERANQNNPTMY